MDYWAECIKEAFEDAKIVATQEQIDTVISWVEGAHENYGLATGLDTIPNPLALEIKELEKKLERERSKTVCPDCKGKGYIVIDFGVRSSESSCGKCVNGWVYQN